MDKESLREKMRTRRLEMPAEQVEVKSRIIINKLVEHIDWTKAASLHCYVPISRLNEVGTWEFLKYIWQNQPQIITAVPAARRKGKYEAVRVGPATRWRGLLPTSRISLPAEHQFDLIIVPVLAFDSRLFRLGWGGGFYDRFLAGQKRARKIGLCFDNAQTAKIPNEPHDIALDEIITEQGIISKS